MKKATKNLIFYGTFAAVVLITVYMYLAYNYDGFVGAAAGSASAINPKNYPGGEMKGARVHTSLATVYNMIKASGTYPPTDFEMKIYNCNGYLVFNSRSYANQAAFDAFLKKQNLKSAENTKYDTHTIFIKQQGKYQQVPAGSDIANQFTQVQSSIKNPPPQFKSIIRGSDLLSIVFDNYEYPPNKLKCKTPTS